MPIEFFGQWRCYGHYSLSPAGSRGHVMAIHIRSAYLFPSDARMGHDN